MNFFFLGAQAIANGQYSGGAGVIVMSFVDCDSHENRLIDCPQSTATRTCSHSEDAGVRCRSNEGKSVAIVAANLHVGIWSPFVL